jgi:hypothetical protein
MIGIEDLFFIWMPSNLFISRGEIRWSPGHAEVQSNPEKVLGRIPAIMTTSLKTMGFRRSASHHAEQSAPAMKK